MADKDSNGCPSLHVATETKLEIGSLIFKNSHIIQTEQHLLTDELASVKKAKRRRTSPQDHGILEAAYLKNSKPDKNERADIVRQVHMVDKEVQIWFQNRRQIDRRRSKPLDAQEVMAHVRKSQTPPTTKDSDITSKSDEESHASSRLSACHHVHPTPTPSPITELPSSPSAIKAMEGVDLPGSTGSIIDGFSGSVSPSAKAIDNPSSTTEAPKSARGKELDATPTSGSKTEVECLSGSGRKRDHAEMSCGYQTSSHVPPVPAKPAAIKSKGPLKRSTSVRLSMTAEGAVKIRTNDDLSPSPPKERALPPTIGQKTQAKGIRRSFSLFEDHATEQVDQVTKPRMLHAGFGRSRDARTWEFYCDSNVKEALSTQVEAERNGSAVGAINLIRSNNHKSRGAVLSPALTRGNASISAAMSKAGKPKMARAKSSLARLQSSEADYAVSKANIKGDRHERSPSGDSDKENWAPGTRMSNNHLRRTEPGNSHRPILQSSGSQSAPAEVISIGRESAVKSGNGGDYLDCIHGLLSLSQGAWR